MEAGLGADLGQVRVHADDAAAEAARAVQARAFTIGNHVVFGRGQYAPDRGGGRDLLAHELAHTIQQAGAPATGPLRVSRPDDPSERHAEAAARAVRDGVRPPPGAYASAHIARQPEGTDASPVDTMAGTQISEIIVSLARKRVGFRTARRMILGDIETDLTAGSYVLKPDVTNRKWVIEKPAVKVGLRFEVSLEGADPWTLSYPETLPLTVTAGLPKEPKTWGQSLDAEGKPLDPLWLYEDMPAELKPKPVTSLDEFDSIHYDISYRSEGGNLSKWLLASYPDGTWRDIPLDTITESTPRLMAAKREALKIMDEYNAMFILGAFPTVFFIITISPFVAPAGGSRPSYRASRRVVPRSKAGDPKQRPVPKEEPPAPGTKSEPAPEVDAAALGTRIGENVRSLPGGKRAAIARQVSDAKLGQDDAVIATGKASEAAFGRIGGTVTMPNGDKVVPSVQAGPNQPVFVVHPNGQVRMGRATIKVDVTNPQNPLQISNIVLE
jgi:hypothetical protein